MAIAPDGRPYVAWQDSSSGNYEIYVRRWSGSTWEEVGTGSASGGGVSSSSIGSSTPSVAIAADGTPYIVWDDYNGSCKRCEEIYVRRWNGSTWEEVGAGSASGGGISNNDTTSWSPSVAIAPDGTPYVAWSDMGSSGNTVYVRQFVSPMIPPLIITTDSPLPDGTVGVPYSVILEVAGGAPPYTWSVSASSLPPGLVLDPATGVISGTPTDGGTYTFNVGCAASVGQTATKDFTITINNPSPTLTGLSPSSASTGMGDLTLTVNGTNFVSSSQVLWNDGSSSQLTTSYVSPTELTAVVPMARLAAVKTAEITIFNPAPGGGTSNMQAFFVNETGAAVADQNVDTGTNPTASAGGVTATASGNGTIVVAEYSANPGNTPSFSASSVYFDVYASRSSGFSQVEIVACNLNGGTVAYW